MCGVTGIIRFDGGPVEEEVLSTFNDSLTHRGPDGKGVYLDVDSPVGLGHRRLSILDLSQAGRQPMADGSERLVITYNGEVYNYLELREELAGKGHVFRTRTDTEVILAAYGEWGPDCVNRFNGMWAFAIWDRKRRELFISRDRFGVKPLYYAHIPGRMFAFASESVAFGSLADYRKEFDEVRLTQGIRNVFYLEAMGETIYRGISKLRPGHNLRVTAGGRLEVERWWDTRKNLVSVPGDYGGQVSEFRRLLTDACKVRLRSDVSIGVALSGGLDSSSIYGLIKHIEREEYSDLRNLPDDWQTAFVASFPDTTMDEKEFAEEVVNYTKGNARYIYPTEDRIVEQIVRQVQEEDFIYLSPPIVHTIYKEMRGCGVKVSIDGHGADEMLFGYPGMLMEWALGEKDRALSEELRKVYATTSGFNVMAQEERSHFPEVGGMKRPMLKRIYDRLIPRAMKDYYREWSYERDVESRYLRRYAGFSSFWDPDGAAGDLSFGIPYRKFHIDSLPTLLRNWDRASMHHGVEIRMPFMDWRLVTFVFSLPGDAKVGMGLTKRILRDSVEGLIPEGIRLRQRKVGINAPAMEWFNGPMNTFLLDAVNSASFLNSSIWNGALIRGKVERLCREKMWTQSDSNDLWPYINAWILTQRGG